MKIENLKKWLAGTPLFNIQNPKLEKLCGDGSARIFFRLQTLENQSLVALYGPDPKENIAYFNFGSHLWFKSLPLPRLYDFSPANGFFLMTDLGDTRLYDLPPEENLYLEAAKILAKFHYGGLKNFNPAWCYQSPKYDAGLIYEKEFFYFLTEMGRYLKWPKPGTQLLKEGRALAHDFCQEMDLVLMHRDFQSRNLMVKNSPGEIYIIDWQGARLGPAAYDLASLLMDPYVNLSPMVQEQTIKAYVKASLISEKKLRKELINFSISRLMQAMGAYAKLTRLGKKGYEPFMLPAAQRLVEIFTSHKLKKYPQLHEKLLQCLSALEQKYI